MNGERMRMEKVLLYIISASAVCVVSSLTVRQYHFIYDPKNWTDAQSYCRETYTDLVTVNSSSVVTVLNSKVDVTKLSSTKDAWIGLNFDVLNWKWSLSDDNYYQNNEANFLNWQSGQPDTLWYTAGCVLLYVTGEWYDTYCDLLYRPICSNVSEQNVTFVLINTYMNWTDAQSYCREHHTDLASVRNMSENQKIMGLVNSGYVWIGLYRNTWRWSNGDMYFYRYWASTPQGGMKKCGAADFGVSGLWRDWTCDVKKAFICYLDAVPFTRQVLRVRLVKNSALDLNDPAVQDSLLKELKQQLKNQEVTGDVKLSWKTQPNGEIFFEDKKDQK